MRRIRIIPTLLLEGSGGLVKTIGFKNPIYLGDPINTVKIFNEKEVDELVLLDINATKEKRPPNIPQIIDIVSEAFMPVGYGGGITKVSEVTELLMRGVEKVIINSAAQDLRLIEQSAKAAGSQSVVVSIDVKKNIFGQYRVFTHNGKVNTGKNPIEYAKMMENAGSGELIINAIDHEGKYVGYDLVLLKLISAAVGIPIVASGGASSVADFRKAVTQGGASAVAAGSFFVFHGASKGILINFPSQDILKNEVFNQI